MSNRNIKFILGLLAFLIISNSWLLLNLEIKSALYVLSLSVLLLFLAFVLFFIEVKRVERENIALVNVLAKSEENRINAEKLKNEILLIINDLPEGFLIINRDDKVSIINNKAEKFLGVNRRQVLNKSILELGHLSNVKKIVFPLLVNFKGTHTEEIEVRKNFILDLAIEPLVLGKNNIVKLIIMRDVTKIKYAETSKGQFVSVAAHQLKAPLSAARLSLRMLLNGDFGKINKKQRDIIEKTHRENGALIYLVEDLLREAKIDGVEQANNKSLVSLEDLVGPVVDFYIDEIKRKKINFKFNKPSKASPKILADRERIKIVIQNLLDNAVKYTHFKGEIKIDIMPKNGEVEFRIKDSGIGIPEDQTPKIFTRFSRAVNVLKTKTSGSGLGLSIAKDIIEKNHGKIWFQSKENKGSTFFFSLPFANN